MGKQKIIEVASDENHAPTNAHAHAVAAGTLFLSDKDLPGTIKYCNHLITHKPYFPNFKSLKLIQTYVFSLFECDGNNNEKELDAWEREDKVIM